MDVGEIISTVRHGAAVFFLPRPENDYRARIFTGSFLIIFFFALVFLKMSFAFFIYSFSNNRFYADITKTELVELANQERARNNLPPLATNPLLDTAAYMKALDMVKSGYFAHNSPTGTTPWYWFDRSGYDYKYAGENLAIGFVESKEVNSAWLASPTHKANIDNTKYKEVGIAVLKSNFQGNPVTLVVQMFGTKQGKGTATSQAATPSNSLARTGLAGNAGADAASKQAREVLGAAVVAPDRQSWFYKLVEFFSSQYFEIIQVVIYGSIALVILLLMLNFFMKADLEHADLLAKAVGFVVIMALFAMLDQSMVVALLPHSLSIY
ncbi:MAG: CAP domain-containing protein [Candidatus Pacebacteria bacterium]|jgi:hypothetical protein|nr:CAP domain-containing protein [Candidatus Paceibacterota bacterium]